MEIFNPQITVIQGAKGFFGAKDCAVSDVIEQIRKCSIQDKIMSLREEKDPETNRLLKSALPAIMFSGTFKARGDINIENYSGLCVIDLDHLEDVKSKKEEISKFPFVLCAFVSPNGDGLKVVCRLPVEMDKHRGRYLALIKFLNQPDIDPTSQNLERLCFASADADIYYNPTPEEFTDYINILQKAKPIGEVKEAKYTNYAVLNIAVNKIRFALDGKKHEELLKASKLMGGYIASGMIEEGEAKRVLENEISKKDIADFKGAQKTIEDGINHGKLEPIFEIEKSKINISEAIKSHKVLQDDDNFDFVADDITTLQYLQSIRDGSFKMGLTTGMPELDEYFRFKEGNVVVINGHDNVGKSTIIWYLAVLSAINHGWSWIIFSAENKTGGIYRKIIEFKECQPIKDMSEEKYMAAYKWARDHFTVLKNYDTYVYKDILAMATKLMGKKEYKAMLVDPYNSLHRDKDKSQTVHDYDYEVMGDIRQWAEKYVCSVYINCHVQTEALRRTYPQTHQRYAGLPMPPGKADTEGGGKFANRTDDFLTIHRMTTHPEDWMWNEIHVRKIRENETGGKQTIFDKPVRLKILIGGVGFETENGFNPIKPSPNFYSNKAIDFSEPRKDKDFEF